MIRIEPPAVEPMDMRASTAGILRRWVVSLWLNLNAQPAITDMTKKAVFSPTCHCSGMALTLPDAIGSAAFVAKDSSRQIELNVKGA